MDAIRTATYNPARFLGLTGSLGTVETGKLAELVLLDANPLSDITNASRIQGVMLRGVWFDRGALDGMLVDVEKSAKGSN